MKEQDKLSKDEKKILKCVFVAAGAGVAAMLMNKFGPSVNHPVSIAVYALCAVVMIASLFIGLLTASDSDTEHGDGEGG